MKEEEKRQNQIDKFINDEMSSHERELFEKATQEDEQLAQDVALNQDLKDFFNHDSLALEQKLSAIGDKFFLENETTKSPSNSKWLIGSAFLILVTLASLIYWNNSTPPSLDNSQKDATIESEIQPPVEGTIEQSKEETKTNPNENTSNEVTGPIASIDPNLYSINPILENLLNEELRDSDNTVLNKIPDTEIQYADKIVLTLQGTTNFKPPYQLVIYTNKEVDFSNDYRVLDEAIKAEKNNDVYSFSFNSKLSLEKGLYYYVLLEEKTSDLIYINKFSVK